MAEGLTIAKNLWHPERPWPPPQPSVLLDTGASDTNIKPCAMGLVCSSPSLCITLQNANEIITRKV